MIRVSEVHVGAAGEELVLSVLRSGQLAQGPMVARFEEAFADVAGTAHAVAVANGTVALSLALEALEIGAGDEVITSPWTFAATLNAVLARGAVARLVDIRTDDFCLAADALAAAAGPATRAVLPVHMYGHPADMPAITAVGAAAGLTVVEDAAQAHGAAVGDRPVGSLGDAACFSFYATKNLTTGEGGMVTTDDPAVAARLRTLRNQGMGARYAYELPGHNARMTDLQAAIGVAEVAELAARTERRRANAAVLSAGLAGIEGLTLPDELPGRRHVYHQYTVRVGPSARLDRDALATELQSRGIGTGVHYPRPLHAYDCYRSHPRVLAGPLPEAERAGREVLSLPIHPWLTPTDLDHIVTSLTDLL